VDFLIKQLKFHGHLAVARLLGEWLGECLEKQNRPLPDCIIPVPLHPVRLRERGFNQALELARPIARHLGLAVQASALRRIRHTLPQSLIDAQVRHSNVRGAFIVDPSLSVRHVAVVDDVITTGSTVGETARILRTAGVTEIEIWACARTIPNR
jgi:ComF family protein